VPLCSTSRLTVGLDLGGCLDHSNEADKIDNEGAKVLDHDGLEATEVGVGEDWCPAYWWPPIKYRRGRRAN
jgi:hypothetical protein